MTGKRSKGCHIPIHSNNWAKRKYGLGILLPIKKLQKHLANIEKTATTQEGEDAQEGRHWIILDVQNLLSNKQRSLFQNEH